MQNHDNRDSPSPREDSPSGARSRLARILLVTALGASIAVPAAAATVKGIEFPDHKSVGGKKLALTGAGVRDMLVVDVYAAGMYSEKPVQDAQELVASDQTKQFRMVMIRAMTHEQAAKAFTEGVEKNVTPAQMNKVRYQLDKLLNAIPPKLEKGQELVGTYAPGRGLTVTGPGMNLMFPGKDFADALFSIWLGPNPVDRELKAALVAARKPAA